MRNHNELKKAVMEKMEFFQVRNINPTAQHIYKEIIQENRAIEKRYNFRSFVRLIPTIKNIKPVIKQEGVIRIYMLR